MSIQNDIAIIRDLCKQYMEIAMSDKHIRMRQRFKDSNDLKIVRPPVIMEEIPWFEMNYEGALDCRCEDGGMRGMEYGLRVALFREKYFKCDNYIEPCWVVHKSYSNTGLGFSGKEERLAVDQKNNIVSHNYIDVLEDESCLEVYHDPVITPHPENDERTLAHIREIVGDTIPVVLRGHGISHAPWDVIPRLHGVENVLMDIYERPEFLHKVIGLFTRGMEKEMDQMEQYGLYDPNGLSLHQ